MNSFSPFPLRYSLLQAQVSHLFHNYVLRTYQALDLLLTPRNYTDEGRG